MLIRAFHLDNYNEINNERLINGICLPTKKNYSLRVHYIYKTKTKIKSEFIQFMKHIVCENIQRKSFTTKSVLPTYLSYSRFIEIQI